MQIKLVFQYTMHMYLSQVIVENRCSRTLYHCLFVCLFVSTIFNEGAYFTF